MAICHAAYFNAVLAGNRFFFSWRITLIDCWNSSFLLSKLITAEENRKLRHSSAFFSSPNHKKRFVDKWCDRINPIAVRLIASHHYGLLGTFDWWLTTQDSTAIGRNGSEVDLNNRGPAIPNSTCAKCYHYFFVIKVGRWHFDCVHWRVLLATVINQTKSLPAQ